MSASAAYDQHGLFTYRYDPMTAAASACNVFLSYLKADAQQCFKGRPCGPLLCRAGFCRVSNVLLTSGNEPCLRHALVSCSIRMSLASQEEQRAQWPADAPFKPLSCVQLM